MAKKRNSKQSSSKPRDDVRRVTGRMPEWMQEYLSDKGIEGEFSLSKLSKEQCLALELAEHLFHQESQGHIRATYDPRKYPEPQPEYAQETGNSALERQGAVE